MATDTDTRYKELLSYFEGIRDERATAANTAARVGRAFIMLLDYYANGYTDRYLSRLSDDTALGIITFLKGLLLGDGTHGITEDGAATLASLVTGLVTSPGFTSDDILAGRGLHAYEDADGRSHVVTDFLTARMKAYFAELQVQKITYSGGNRILSAAGNDIDLVEAVSDANGRGYRCWFRLDDGDEEVENMWQVGDQALCREAGFGGGTATGAGSRYYWRLVTETGTAQRTLTADDGSTEERSMGYVVLSDSDAEAVKEIYAHGVSGEDTVHPWNYGSNPSAAVFVMKDAAGTSEPRAGDTIVQAGSQTDTGRMKAMQIATTSLGGEPAPAILFYSGVNRYALTPTFYISTDGISGRVKFVDLTVTDSAGNPVQLVAFRGAWLEGSTYTRGDMVAHGGQSWLWNNEAATTTEPSEAGGWTLVARSGSDGKDGQAIQVQVSAEGGSVIRQGETEKTLTARVLAGTDDITARLPASAFSWVRHTGHAEADAVWNENHAGKGPTVTITPADVFGATQFDCIVEGEY